MAHRSLGLPSAALGGAAGARRWRSLGRRPRAVAGGAPAGGARALAAVAAGRAWARASPSISPCRPSRRSGSARPASCWSRLVRALAPVARAGRIGHGLGAGPARPRHAARGLRRRDAAHPSGRGAGAGAARRLLARGDRPAGRGTAARPTRPARRAADRGARCRRHAGAAPGQHARRRAAAAAGRPGPAAGAADAAFTAGRAARLRLRPPGLFRAAGRGRLYDRLAAGAGPRAERPGWSIGLAALRQTIAGEIASAVPGTAGRDRGGAADRPARRAARRDLGPMGDRRHRAPALDLGPPPRAGRGHAVLRRADRAGAGAAAGPAPAGQEARGAARAARRVRLPADLGRHRADPARLRDDRARPARGDGRPQSVLDAAGRLGGLRGAAAAAGKPARRLVPDVVRRRRRADRGLRDRGRAPPRRDHGPRRPPAAVPCRRRAHHDRRERRDHAVLDLPLQPFSRLTASSPT